MHWISGKNCDHNDLLRTENTTASIFLPNKLLENDDALLLYYISTCYYYCALLSMVCILVFQAAVKKEHHQCYCTILNSDIVTIMCLGINVSRTKTQKQVGEVSQQ